MPRSTSSTREGLIVGLIAYGCVAAFYSAFDVLASRSPLFTVNLLGLAVFRGLRDPTVLRLPIPLDPNAIFVYNALHLVLSLAIGLFVTRLVWHALTMRIDARMIYLSILAGGVATVLAAGWFTAGMRPLLPYWSIVAANVLASAVAASYLVRAHPGLLGSVAGALGLRRGDEGGEVAGVPVPPPEATAAIDQRAGAPSGRTAP